MTELSRRTLLAAAAGAPAAALPATAAVAAPPASPAPVVIRPGDRRYDGLLRGNNWRFTGAPDEIRIASSTADVVRAVSDAVRTGRRIAPRSGGHCFEDFTADPAVRMLLDLKPMNAVGWDADRRAHVVEPGATLGEVYRALFTRSGVTVPGGSCPEVGAGGHVAGGGYGPLSRRYGSVVDHLYGVEVVVPDAARGARAIVATREPGDPHRDLWWAHTGAGGGSFGVVTKYLLRDLPPVPRTMLQHVIVWSWEGMTEAALTGLVRNFGTWHERHSAPGTPECGVYGILDVAHRSAGTVMLVAQIDADLPDAGALVDGLVSAVTAGTGLTPVLDLRTSIPWLHRMTWPGSGEPGDVLVRRYKIKAAYLRRGYTEAQLAAIWRHLTGAYGGGTLLIGYGGQANAVAPDATAIAQRSAVMKAICQSVWREEAHDDAMIAWVRDIYRDVFGDVPADGSYINYPDTDLPRTAFYGANYPRLRRVKSRYDPANVFRHGLSVEPL
ncbi:FAD-binding oxidoreductase [Catenuloplanes atrovinosus]|uniref:Aclacinomycin oxidase n=1 Tax=Catenuloplanes atrovinosus TaxID=137266 RepID=A0AAE4C8A9_9ACTN|nr:FAD-binding oxidoreductase [Catenuloplanes atrovinosus]MDR7274798.1 aclacinomycin oxidase [Catenuloplanes atrovinosus]